MYEIQGNHLVHGQAIARPGVGAHFSWMRPNIEAFATYPAAEAALEQLKDRFTGYGLHIRPLRAQ